MATSVIPIPNAIATWEELVNETVVAVDDNATGYMQATITRLTCKSGKRLFVDREQGIKVGVHVPYWDTAVLTDEELAFYLDAEGIKNYRIAFAERKYEVQQNAEKDRRRQYEKLKAEFESGGSSE